MSILRFRAHPAADVHRSRSRGQVLVIFTLSIFVFVGLCAVVVDVAWYWGNNLRMQRAADAAALAGVVFLPSRPDLANAAAFAEASKNGYANGVGGVSIDPRPDPANGRRMLVSIRGPVRTYFANLFGLRLFNAARDSKADYVLPVPMGSPENYYGTFGLLRSPGGGITTTTTTPGSTGLLLPANTPSGNWTNPGNALTHNDSSYATHSSTTNPFQAFGGFGITIPSGNNVSVTGISVETRAGASDATGCEMRVTLGWDGDGVTGNDWTGFRTVNLGGMSPPATVVVGGAADDWGRSWSASNLNNSNFRVRVQYRDPQGAGCTDGYTLSLDHVRVRVHWSTTSSTFVPDCTLRGPGSDLTDPCDPTGPAINSRGFWGTMHNPGSSDVDGDAYLPRFETVGGTANDQYNPIQFYDYAIEMSPGTSNGRVWIFDPVFCATAGSGRYGTGDRYFGGPGTRVSAFYDVLDTRETPYTLSDDLPVAGTSGITGGSSGSLFRGIAASDPDLGGPTGNGLADCSAGATNDPNQGRYWHNKWWPLVTGLSGGATGRTYRIRTASTDASNNNGNGHNSFAIYGDASGGSVKIHGVGAMEAYTPLDPGEHAEFYLAQIDSVHAGKIMEISLWDPGDTGDLTAHLKIRKPTSSGWEDAALTWTSKWGTTNSNRSSCNNDSGSGTSIETNDSGQSHFNGCWLTISIQIPSNYSAPQDGWWKIEYDMGTDDNDPAFDLTTWQVAIRGNPVHLVVP